MPPGSSQKSPATVESKPLALNGVPITVESALEKLTAIYGSRATAILTGLNAGTYGGASVAEGYIKIVKEQPQPVSTAPKEK